MASAALVTSCGALTRRVWTRTELSCTSSEERSPDTCIVHLSAFHAQRLFDPSDSDQDGILHSAIGVIACGACVAQSVMFRLSKLSIVYPHTAELSVSNVGGQCHGSQM